MEEKSREIAEAAHEYAWTRLRNWAPTVLMVVAVLVVFALTQEIGDVVIDKARVQRETDIDRLTERLKMAALITVVLQVLGAAAVIWWAGRFMVRWRYGDPAVTTAPPLGAETASAEPPSKGLEWLSVAAPFALILGGYYLAGRASPRFQPLIVSGALTLLVLTMLLSGRRRPSAGARRDSPGPTLGLIAANVYALAIAAGLRRPFGAASADTAETFGLIAPTALLFTCWAVGDAIYSRRQFRRLQRLVNEDPPREGNRDA